MIPMFGEARMEALTDRIHDYLEKHIETVVDEYEPRIRAYLKEKDDIKKQDRIAGEEGE